jgi:O-antigen/teichoic acid export membrane protein
VLVSTLSNYAGQATTLLTWFLLTPFLVTQLGDDAYGLFVLVTALAGYTTLLDLGVTSSVTRYVAALRAQSDFDGLRRLVATGFVVSLALCGITVALGVALAPLVPDAFGVPDDERETARNLVYLAAISAGLVFPTGTLFAVLRGLQRYDLANALGVVATLLVAAATVVAVLAGGGVLWVVGVTIPVTIIMQIPAARAVRWADPRLRLSRGRPRAADVKTIASFSWAVSVIQGANQIKTRTDEVVIAAFLPVARVTPYSLARRAAEAPQLLTYQFTRVLLPLSSDFSARGQQDRLRSIVLAGTRIALGAHLVVTSSFVVLAGPFLEAWVGGEYRNASTILIILAVAGTINLATWPAGAVLQGLSRHRPFALFAIVGASVNLGVSIALIHPFGPAGVALGTLIASGVETFLLSLPYALKTVGLRARAVVESVLLPTLVPVAPSMAVAWILRAAFNPTSLGSVVGIGSIAAIVYCGCYFCFPVSRFEGRLILDLALRMRRALAGKPFHVGAR